MSQIFFLYCNRMLRISGQGRDYQTLCTYVKKIVTLANQLHLEQRQEHTSFALVVEARTPHFTPFARIGPSELALDCKSKLVHQLL